LKPILVEAFREVLTKREVNLKYVGYSPFINLMQLLAGDIYPVGLLDLTFGKLTDT
jgi:hypothetical protein